MQPRKPFPDWVFKVLRWLIIIAIIFYFIKWAVGQINGH